MQAAASGAHPHSWLWGSEDDFADFKMGVFAADAKLDTEALYSLSLHALVLAAASPGHFRGHCIRQRREAATQPEKQQGKKGKKAAGTKRRASDTTDQDVRRAVSEYRLVLFPREPENVPKAVLCHLYTGALPDDPEELIWMLRRADYWDPADTVHAVLHKLISAGSKQLTLQHAAVLHSLPAFQCDTRQGEAAGQPAPAAAPAAAGAAAQAAAAASGPAPAKTVSAQLQELTDSLLLAHLPSAPAIVTDAALLAQFAQLPLALVKRWVELDKYEVDSGNTLAVLFTAWYDEQYPLLTSEQCKQLSDMLPLSDVSLCFHEQALQHFSWWKRSVGSFKSLTAHMLGKTVGGSDAHSYQEFWQSKAGNGLTRQIDQPQPSAFAMRLAGIQAEQARKGGALKDLRWRSGGGGGALPAHRPRNVPKKHTWTVTATQLMQLWNGGTGAVHKLPSFYHGGYELSAWLQLKHASQDTDKTGPLRLGFYTRAAWPAALGDQKLIEVSPADAFVSVVHFALADAQKACDVSLCAWGQWGIGLVDKSFVFDSPRALVPKPTTTLMVKAEIFRLAYV